MIVSARSGPVDMMEIGGFAQLFNPSQIGLGIIRERAIALYSGRCYPAHPGASS